MPRARNSVDWQLRAPKAALSRCQVMSLDRQRVLRGTFVQRVCKALDAGLRRLDRGTALRLALARARAMRRCTRRGRSNKATR